MQVRVFEAKDMTTGLKMVKEALGPDALILSTRTVRSGRLGVLGKPMMEITAAIDNRWPEDADRFTADRRTRRQDAPLARDRERVRQQGDRWPHKPLQNIAARPPQRQQPAAEAIADPEAPIVSHDLHNEVAELRAIVRGLSSRITTTDPPVVRRPYLEPECTATPADPAVRYLTGFGINQETAEVVARFTRDTIAHAGCTANADLNAIFQAAIARLFTTAELFPAQPERQRRISLIGPTGVGKTTTLAKIAARSLSHGNYRVGLITIDTYRVAAVEQLKVYGEIMRLPVEVVLTPEGFHRALERLVDCDLVLIDTAGRSPRNQADLDELAAFLCPELGLENHLLLPATAREGELALAIRRFAILPVHRFVFSKIDECGQLGVLLNVHYNNDTPISCLTNGQRVPEDLLTPTPADIAALIMDERRRCHHG
ncbi:MAG: flagellar biosynthesis protein FlhF [Desulfobulbus sp.]|jgi:flagellar biosynthesis protein FlhF|nr:flagellar biosynthesis protein FlhF [Desulfobulbus sp.]